MPPRLHATLPLLGATASRPGPHVSAENFNAPAFLERILSERNEAEPGSTPAATETNRRIFGRYWEEFRSLAQESDPSLFYEGLFSTAARLESENYSDAAARIYRALSEGAASLPSPLQARARRRWEAMAGIGTSGARVEFLLRRFAVECADPSTLLGMGLAGAAFRMTRLAVLSRLAATPGLGLLTRGFGARLTAGLAGYAVEGLVFPAATRFGRWTLGHSQDWNARQLGRELALSYLSLGFLRLGGGLAARGSAAFAVPGSFTARILPVAGMWLGLVMSHQAETALGLRSRQDGATTFLDSLAMLLQFHVAGRLTHHAFGESFAVWEQGMELQSRALSRAEPLFPDFGTLGAGSHARPLLVSGAESVPELPTVMMSSKEEGNGGRASPPAAGPRETILPSAPRPGNVHAGLEVESFAQILRHIATPAFRTQFQAENAMFRFKEAFPEDLQSRVESLQSYLNIFSSSARWRIPVGRRLTIHSVAGNQTLYFFKSSNAGFEIRLPSPVIQEEGTRLSSPDLAGVNSDMRAVAAKSRLSGTFTEFPRVVRAASELREVIPAVLRNVKPGKSFQASFVLERAEIEMKALSEATQGLQAKATGTFRVLVPQLRRTYVGLAGPHGISWQQSLSAGWGSALGRAIFSEAVLKNAEEAYQQVEAYSRDRNRQPDTESRWTVREKVGDPEGFSRFLLETLNSYRVNGRKISVHLTVEGKKLEFEGTNGTWRSDIAREPSRAEPVARPVRAEPKDSPEAVQEIEAEDPAHRGIVLKSVSIPLLHQSDMEHISAVLQRAYDDRAEREGPRVVIVETPSLKAPEGRPAPQLSSTLLAKLTQGLRSFEAGTEFLVLNVPSRQTFLGRVVSDTLHWSVGNSSEWRVAAMRTLRHQPVKVGNAVELYLYLQALPNHMRRYAREESELNSREISIVWDGPMPRTFQYDLKTFVSYSLITHNPYGKNLTIEFASGAPPIRMENYQGDLWMEQGEDGAI